ncbi:metal ABC transporter solute-binding protein, Zn/Mn family [Bifidobacterium aquikefiri]|uniref:metal ABC transporter solute-binding protein, Zn/Mn family n=2 Tax=Bifidobacterium aquikefiri TaxID=1653207 RepID=UPI0039EAA2FE
MKQHRGLAQRILAALLTMSAVIALSACSLRSQSSATPSTTSSTLSGPIPVVATIRPWGSLAQELGGNQVKVTTIISDPNLAIQEYEPKTTDITTIGKSRIEIVNGAGYDDWATKSVPKDATLVSAADAVGASEGDNPYLWFSKDVRNSVATEVTEAYIKALPNQKAYFNARLKAWRKSETTLETLIQTVASQSKKKLTYAQERPIAYYLMADLGFSDKTPKKFAQALSGNEEPTVDEVDEFVNLLGKSKHPSIFLEDSTRQSTETQEKLVTTAKGNAVPMTDVTEEMPTQETTLNEWISTIITNIAKALELRTKIQSEDSDAESTQATVSDSASPSTSGSDATPSSTQ